MSVWVSQSMLGVLNHRAFGGAHHLRHADALDDPTATGRLSMTIHEHDGDNVTELKATNLEATNPDVAELEPLGTEEEFAEEVRELVASSAPRVFALVEEYGERVDGRVVAWGMTFDEEEHTEVINVGFSRYGSFNSAEQAQRLYSRSSRKIRLVWTSTLATRPAEQAT
ncbi:MAG: hypothetical protein ACRDTF_09660 [Pseudonocardiaceae bacterium]